MNPHYSRTPPTRSIFQPKLIFICTIIFIVLLGFSSNSNTQLNLEDAMFLTRNSFKELKDLIWIKGGLGGGKNVTSTEAFRLDLDYPLNSAVNSFFPIDSIFSYNLTEKGQEEGNYTTYEIVGRYASFSPILNQKLSSKYRIFPTDACHPIGGEMKKEYDNKILIILRGGCTFVDKVSNVLNSDIDPSAVVIANDEPYRGLITMYSTNFNQDGSLHVPIMFITNEDYKTLKLLEKKHLTLEVESASLGTWFNVIISMVLSPPLLILFFYLVIICGQKLRKRQVNLRNSKLVRKLPVYIFNNDHMIYSKYFSEYLKATNQTLLVPREEDEVDSLKSSPKSNTTSSSSLNKIIINGVDIRKSANRLHALVAPQDFYPAYKCSICLDKYTALKSRVLVLDCKHFYHEKCLSNWLINFKRSCPLCNTSISHRGGTSLLDGINSDYGSINDTDLEAQSQNLVEDPFLLESDESDADYYHDNQVSEPTPQEYSDILHVATDSSVPLDSTQAVPLDTDSANHYYSHQDAGHSVGTENSQVSDSTSFFSASSELPETPVKPTTPRNYYYSRPLQILSQFSINQPQSENALSVSIDSGDFITPQNSPSISLADTTRLSQHPHDSDSTINLTDEVPQESSENSSLNIFHPR